MELKYSNKNFIIGPVIKDKTLKEKNFITVTDHPIIPVDLKFELIRPTDIVNSYNDFLARLNVQRDTKESTDYYCFLTEDNGTSYLTIIYQIITKYDYNGNDMTDGDYRLLCVYKLENSDFLDFVEKLLNIKMNGATEILTDSTSYYNFLMAPEVLKVLFTQVDIVSNHELPFREIHGIKSKSGKARTVIAPHPKMKEALVSLNFILQKTYDNINEDFQVAYKHGKSVKDNAEIHKDKKYVYNLDLHHFYQSCKRELVRKYIAFLFVNNNEKERLENMFLDDILIDDGLFIGSPISGCLANTIISKPVEYMKNIAAKHDMGFSVYADDMSFSSDKKISKNYAINIFKSAFASYGLDKYFTLNEDKCHGFSGSSRRVTGVIINDNNKLSVHRYYYRDIRVKLNKLKFNTANINLDDLRGKIAYATMLDESGKIKRLLTKYSDIVIKYKLCSKEIMKELTSTLKKTTKKKASKKKSK